MEMFLLKPMNYKWLRLKMKDRYVNVCARSSPATMLANYGGVVISAEFLEEWVILLLTQPGKIVLALIGPVSEMEQRRTKRFQDLLKAGAARISVPNSG